MKFLKPTRSLFFFLLCLCLLAQCSEVFAFNTVDNALSWANSEWGGSNGADNWDDAHNHEWAWWCLHFVGHAYGLNSAGFSNAFTAWEDNGSTFGDRITTGSAPKGALVFFDATAANLYYGHVGIATGDGNMYHAWTDGVHKDSISFGGQYLGWRWPTTWTNSLITADGTTIYWIQNNKIYHVTTADVLNTMQNAGIPGWNWSSVATVSSLSSYAVRSEFATTGPFVSEFMSQNLVSITLHDM